MIDLEILQTAFNNLVAGAISYMPRLLSSIIILLLGWALSKLLATIIQRVGERVGLENILEQTGIKAGLEKAQIKRSGTEMIAKLIFWIIFLNFLLIGLENLGLNAAVDPLRSLIAYLPRLLAALITLTAGIMLAQFLGRAAQAAMSGMGVDFHQEVGQGVNVLLIIMIVVVVLEQLGIDARIMTDILTNVITIIVAGLALAFALGGRDVARNVLAGFYAREQFMMGDTIEIDGEIGTLEGIGTMNSEIRIGNERLIIPNTHLTDRGVKVKEEDLYLSEDEAI